MTIVSKSKLSVLEFVYPPISNQEAMWVKDDPEVEARIRQSDFYMIAARTEVKFVKYQFDEERSTIDFSVSLGDVVVDAVRLHVEKLAGVVRDGNGRYWIETGEKMVRIWSGPVEAPGSKVLEWFTTEKLIWNRSRGQAGIEGFDRYREVANYDLLYVGIAKVKDTYTQLFENGHKARMKILANEPQRFSGVRVADEIYLFLFKVEPVIVQTFTLGEIPDDAAIAGVYDGKRIVADAEKAFVSMLKPQYNLVKFKNYPKGDDGLYGSTYVRYGYVIAENFTFNTPHGKISGGRDTLFGFISDKADSIFVEGDRVTFHEAEHVESGEGLHP